MTKVKARAKCTDRHCKRHHALHVACDADGGEIVLVRGSPDRAYLWIGPTEGIEAIYALSGAAGLRRLARAILAQTDPPAVPTTRGR